MRKGKECLGFQLPEVMGGRVAEMKRIFQVDKGAPRKHIRYKMNFMGNDD